MEGNHEEMQEPTLPQYYVDTDESGEIIGFYVDAIHGENIPETAIPITIGEWQTYSADASLYKRDGDAIRAKTQAELDAELAARPPAPKSRTELLEEENALLALELAQTQLRFEQAEQEHAALLLELVSKGVI